MIREFHTDIAVNPYYAALEALDIPVDQLTLDQRIAYGHALATLSAAQELSSIARDGLPPTRGTDNP